MITKYDERIFNLARRLIDLTIGDIKSFNNAPKPLRNPTVSIVTLKGSIISTGFNSNKSHPLQKKYNAWRDIPDCNPHRIHAETDALKNIIGLDIDWNKVAIYVYRKRRYKEFLMARPCKSCMALIKDLRIPNIYYTTTDGYAHEKLKY